MTTFLAKVCPCIASGTNSACQRKQPVPYGRPCEQPFLLLPSLLALWRVLATPPVVEPPVKRKVLRPAESKPVRQVSIASIWPAFLAAWPKRIAPPPRLAISRQETTWDRARPRWTVIPRWTVVPRPTATSFAPSIRVVIPKGGRQSSTNVPNSRVEPAHAPTCAAPCRASA